MKTCSNKTTWFVGRCFARQIQVLQNVHVLAGVSHVNYVKSIYCSQGEIPPWNVLRLHEMHLKKMGQSRLSSRWACRWDSASRWGIRQPFALSFGSPPHAGSITMGFRNPTALVPLLWGPLPWLGLPSPLWAALPRRSCPFVLCTNIGLPTLARAALP